MYCELSALSYEPLFLLPIAQHPLPWVWLFRINDESDGAVVDELYIHVGLEYAGFNPGDFFTGFCNEDLKEVTSLINPHGIGEGRPPAF